MFFEIFVSLLVGLISLLFILFIRIAYKSKKIQGENYEKIAKLDIDLDAAISRFSRAITYNTVSYETGKDEGPQILAFIDFLEDAFPLVHSCAWITRRIVNHKSLLYHCQAATRTGDESTERDLRPWMIVAHTDVVPVDQADLTAWDAPPFAGQILAAPGSEARYLYGRGTMDAKHIVMASLESLEHLIRSGRRLSGQSLYLCFGHDEETGGVEGAKVAARELGRDFGMADDVPAGDIEPTQVDHGDYLVDCRKPLSFIIDEGTSVYSGIPLIQAPGIARKLAIVSVSEKYCVRWKLSLNTPPGHSSMPPKENAITLLARAILRLQAHEFDHQLGKAAYEDDAVSILLPYVNSLWIRFLMANRDILRPLILRICDKSPIANSFIRTTSCVVIFNGGIKENVIPSYASACLNQRVHPSQSLEEVTRINERFTKKDKIKLVRADCESNIPFSSSESRAYQNIYKTIKEIFGSETIIIPGLLPGGTDSVNFLRYAENVYRFSPLSLRMSDNQRFHGINERIEVSTYTSCIHFYYRLMENVSGFTQVEMDGSDNN